MGTVAEGEGDAVAILNRNEPAFYCVPPKLYAYYRELAEDAELNAVADERMKNPEIVKVNWMTYELAFDRRALKEWQKLGHTIREQFKKKLAERLKIHAYPQPGYMVMLIAIKSNFVHLATDLYTKSLMRKSFYSLLPLEEGKAAKSIRSQICAKINHQMIDCLQSEREH